MNTGYPFNSAKRDSCAIEVWQSSIANLGEFGGVPINLPFTDIPAYTHWAVVFRFENLPEALRYELGVDLSLGSTKPSNSLQDVNDHGHTLNVFRVTNGVDLRPWDIMEAANYNRLNGRPYNLLECNCQMWTMELFKLLDDCCGTTLEDAARGCGLNTIRDFWEFRADAWERMSEANRTYGQNNCALIRRGSMPKGWGFKAYTYGPQNPRIVAYWREWLNPENPEQWMSAGQPDTQHFQLDIYDGNATCLKYIKVVQPGDRVTVSYVDHQWQVTHNKKGHW